MDLANGLNKRTRAGTATLLGVLGLAAASVGAAGACANGQTSEGGNNGGSSSSSGGSSSGTAGSSSGTGGSSGTGSSSGGPAGSSGSSSGTTGSSSGAGSSSGSPIADAGAADVSTAPCATKVVVTAANPVLINFDTYTGTTPLLASAAFGPPYPLAGYTGPFNYAGADGGPDGVLSMVAGRTGGVLDGGGTDWAIDLSVMPEVQYENAIGFWMSCTNATAFSGISFWVRGMMPTFQLVVTMGTNDTALTSAGGLCTGTCADPIASSIHDAGIPVSFPVWTQIQLPWSAFTGGMKNSAAFAPTGDNITGIQFVARNIAYPVVDAAADGAAIYGQLPENLDLQIDDVEFMP